jgi:DNA-binding response OmpR family regulator
MKIVLVEDDEKISSFITKGFKELGYIIQVFDNGEDAYYFLINENYDIAIIDIMLPKLNGFELIQKLREKSNKIPIIVLSAKNATDDKVKGLELGADDYLTKPFAFSELLSRINAIYRRVNNIKETVLQYADLSLDILTREVTKAGKKIELQKKEYSLLEYLMRNAGRIVTKTMILESIWGYDFDPQTNVVDVLIHRLRKKIDDPFEKKLIHTVHGVGYVLKEK